MSGFAAVLAPGTGSEGVSARLDASLARLRHRASGAPARRVDPGVALGQLPARSATNATATVHQARADGPILCGDLAILEGASLAAAAGSRYRGDALAVLAAYDRWGDDLGHWIEGEFAFVIWDPERHKLLALRDRFGVKPLAYAHRTSAVCLASEPRALIGPYDMPDDLWIAAFLEGVPAPDAGQTPFPEIRMLPPGHRLICERDTLREEAWWQITPREVHEAEAPEALAEALDRAVRARMTGPVATLLSGGLDSSALTCLAARAAAAPIRAVSLRYDTTMPELDEGRYIDAVRATGNIDGIDLPAQPGGSLSGIEDLLTQHGYPIDAPNHPMLSQLYQGVAESGAIAVLDGHGGDEVIGMGDWYFSELAFEKRWLTLWRTLRAEQAAGVEDISSTAMMLRALKVHGPAGLRRLLPAPAPDQTAGAASLVSDAMAARLRSVSANPTGSAALRHDHLHPFIRHHARILLNPGTAQAFEFLDRAGAHRGIEPRFPFYDRHVVEIALGQPSRVKRAPGQPRELLRRAMTGILPELVRKRADKIDFKPSVLAAFRPDQRARLAALSHTLPDLLAPHVSRDRVRAMIANFDHEATRAQALGPLLRLLWLDTWLHMRTGVGVELTKVAG